MSERLNLWPEPTKGWPADVNLADHPSVESAIRAFARHDRGSLNVFGPAEAIEECKATWARLEADDPDIPPSSAVTWVVQASPYSGGRR